MPLTLSLSQAAPNALDTPLLVVALGADEPLPATLTELDGTLHGVVGRALARRDFRGGRDESLHLGGGERGVQRVLLVGTGKATDRAVALRRAASIAARFASKIGVSELAFVAPDADARAVESIAVGLDMGAWRYTDMQTQPPESERRATLERATILADRAAQRGLDDGIALAHGYAVARRLAMMPGNVCTPDTFVETANDIASRFDSVTASAMGRAEMEKEGMGSFLCVAQATPEDPKLVTLQYRGAGDAKPVALVGKGLCFDTGGISIKPAERMEWMKFDMCGAAGVLGAIEAIARMKLPVNVVGVIGATTNMPSGTAVKPGDVVRASTGKTIEIINTDAEGRLVLADCLAYVKRFEPTAVIDAATLTGAIVIALGHNAVGVMGSDAGLVQEVLAAGRRASEPGWELPLWDEYREQIKSDVADIKNTGGRAAGSITAGWFLREFTDYPWVHLDVAGTAYSESDLVALPKGPTGTPTGTFVEFVRGRVR
ncbi:cytosol aminopeptidase [Gemmatirosa kalamazoonensis]|uniref:Probable cytosol aminopeptidase n=1 Tax=Gemmatirosa kalamazoonensis TaxID=861299 RepID=W0RJB2_9BACT|nr:leucyl aminopeptidase [Gemmatirosa kalamazoonensis]AHG90861.1 cytosol aminopeptidase [Gemmatirosa kalamazoonensis]